MKIPLTIPSFDKSEEEALISVIRSGWVTQGPKVLEFEDLVKNYTGSKYAIATSSATTALFLSLVLMGIGKNDEVIVPSFTFIATANVVLQAGAKPVFVDIDPQTYNIDPLKIIEKITSRTRAIMPVDFGGLPADMDPILKIAKKNNLFVLADAAASIGSKYKEKKVGNLADISCFSFHPKKIITSGEGGMILTNNKKWESRAKVLRHHGMSVSDLARHGSKKVINEKYYEAGFNFRMSDLEASVGVEQMKKIDSIIKKRTELANIYNKAFADSPSISPRIVPRGYIDNWQVYILRLQKNRSVTRDILMQKLLEKGISTRRAGMAVHLEPAYKKLYGKISLPVTEKIEKQTIAIPLFPQMKKVEQEYVIDSIIKYIKS